MDDSYAGGDPTADPSADPAAEPAQISVTITAVGDGSYTVAMSEGDESSQDEQGEADAASDQPQTASNIDDALKMAGQMFDAESMEDDAGAADGSDDSAPMAPADAKSYWKQMASKKKPGM